jgi:hypothetical protein
LTTSLSPDQREDHYLAAAKEWVSSVQQREQARDCARQDLRKNPGTLIKVSADTPLVDVYRQLSRGDNHAPAAVGHNPFTLAVTHFVAPIAMGLDAAGLSTHVTVRRGDRIQPLTFPALIKARLIAAPGAGALVPTQWIRHFGPMEKVSGADSPWKSKTPRLVWRGATTGPGPGEKPDRPSSRAHIADVVKRTEGTTRIDVGYSHVVGTRKWPTISRGRTQVRQWPQEYRAADAVRNSLTMAEFLENKYLLALEGNDVASGLKWMMASNSCVLMPPPSVESWFCESFLEPWKHYVPVKPDLSDLEQKVEWCQNNDKVTEEIARAGQEFAKAFVDPVTENALLAAVLRWWASEPILDDATRFAHREIFPAEPPGTGL